MKKKSYNKKIAQIVEEKSIVTSRASTMTTFWNAITGPKFWKASWICAALIFCLRLSGIGLTSIYIISMIRNIAEETEGKFPISPVVGGFLLAIVNAVFAVLMSPLVPKFGRKTLSVCGCLGMFLCNVSAGVCLQVKWYMTSFIAMIMFVFFYVLPGNVIYLYVSEVTVDQAAGLSMGFYAVGSLLFSFTTEYLMVWLTVPGTFYLTACINAINLIFWCCAIESAGKSDKEQKLLYAPKNDDMNEGETATAVDTKKMTA